MLVLNFDLRVYNTLCILFYCLDTRVWWMPGIAMVLFNLFTLMWMYMLIL